MGTRGNIVVSSSYDGTMHFYSHWDAYELPVTVAKALDRGRSRWDDEPYLNRILFCEMVKDDVEGETGYGLSNKMGDGGVEVYVNHDDQTVRFQDETLSFEDFVNKHKDG